MDYILVAAGLALLFLGGEGLVRGSVVISQRLGISAILIGVVVVGFGTSAPELLVSVQASLKGQPEIALGNVVGSNIANVLLILGIAALIAPVMCKADAILRDGLAVLGASLMLLVMVLFSEIGRIAGLLMVLILLGYLVYSYKAEKADKLLAKPPDDETVHEHEAEEMEDIKLSMPWAVTFSAIGIAMLVFGADMLVDGATSIAKSLGISEAVIGLSLIALGTSLPELATAIVASVRKHTDVVIGNVLGSNLFNILSILGITALIAPVPMEGRIAVYDIPLMIVVALTTVTFIAVPQKFGRFTGVFFLLSYIAYIAWLYESGATP